VELFLGFPTWANWAAVAVIVATTLYSGIEYFIVNRDIFDWKK
jgi:CDP-diacylglycerol--glycerol-3-phosphate 3-phosphatidyltransferase